MIIQPVGFTVIEWTEYMTESLSDFGPVPRLLDPDDWKSWASTVCGLPGIYGQQPPSPDLYHDWASWADAFNQSVRLPG